LLPRLLHREVKASFTVALGAGAYTLLSYLRVSKVV